MRITVAVLSTISNTDGNVVVSTVGTKAAPGSKITGHSLVWGDGTKITGKGNPPGLLNHIYSTDGDYTVTLNVVDSKGRSSQASVMIIIRLGPPTPPPPPSGRGQIALTCPSGAIHIAPGQNIQTITNNNPSGTVFCLDPGVHSINYTITPKDNNQYWGELGSIIDGTGWVTSDETKGVFWCHNIGRINVTVKNLVMRNLPQRGIGLFPWDTNTGWIIDQCEIFNCGEGIVTGSNLTVSNSIIHHCRRVGHPVLTGSAYLIGGAYPNVVTNLLFDNNEIYECGAVQKTLDSTNVTWRNNYFHDNDGASIWSDGVGENFLAEFNVIEDAAVGIWYELCFSGIIRNNTIRRMTDQAVFISTSRNAEIYN